MASVQLLLEPREAGDKISAVDSRHHLFTIMGFFVLSHIATDRKVSGTLLGEGLEGKKAAGLGSYPRLPATALASSQSTDTEHCAQTLIGWLPTLAETFIGQSP